MGIIIPESHRDSLERAIVVALATITPAGQPHLTAIWRYFDGTHIRFIGDPFQEIARRKNKLSRGVIGHR